MFAFAAGLDIGVPIKLLDLSGEALPDAYRHALLISRPDQHVAWRGDVLPTDPAALIERLRGGRIDA